MKRKLLSMVLVIMMTAIVLFGCGSTEEVSDETIEVEEEIEEETEESEEIEEEDTDEADDSQNESSKNSLSAKERAAEKEAETEDKEENVSKDVEEENSEESIQVERGIVEDGMYINESIGISFPIAEDMYVLSDKEMMQIYGAGANIVIEDDVYTSEQMEQALQGTLCDIMILFPDGRTNLSIICENMDITANGIYMSEEFYMTVLAAQMESLDSIQYELVDKEEYVELGGKEYLVIEFVIEQGDIEAKQYYYVRREANYMIAFIASCYDGSEYMIEEVLDEVIDPNT